MSMQLASSHCSQTFVWTHHDRTAIQLTSSGTLTSIISNSSMQHTPLSSVIHFTFHWLNSCKPRLRVLLSHLSKYQDHHKSKINIPTYHNIPNLYPSPPPPKKKNFLVPLVPHVPLPIPTWGSDGQHQGTGFDESFLIQIPILHHRSCETGSCRTLARGEDCTP